MILTTRQIDELRKVVLKGDDGLHEGHGTTLRIRRALESKGLIVARHVPWQGANGVAYRPVRWFATDAGKAYGAGIELMSKEDQARVRRQTALYNETMKDG